jgi:hypothetical protein
VQQQQQQQQQRGHSTLRNNATVAAATTSASSVACTLPVHGVVLAAASTYFETLLKNWTGESDRTIHMCVGEEQLQAAKALISFMYQVTGGAQRKQRQQQQQQGQWQRQLPSLFSCCCCCGSTSVLGACLRWMLHSGVPPQGR